MPQAQPQPAYQPQVQPQPQAQPQAQPQPQAQAQPQGGYGQQPYQGQYVQPGQPRDGYGYGASGYGDYDPRGSQGYRRGNDRLAGAQAAVSGAASNFMGGLQRLNLKTAIPAIAVLIVFLAMVFPWFSFKDAHLMRELGISGNVGLFSLPGLAGSFKDLMSVGGLGDISELAAYKSVIKTLYFTFAMGLLIVAGLLYGLYYLVVHQKRHPALVAALFIALPSLYTLSSSSSLIKMIPEIGQALTFGWFGGVGLYAAVVALVALLWVQATPPIGAGKAATARRQQPRGGYQRRPQR